jgi:hypothetical protein
MLPSFGKAPVERYNVRTAFATPAFDRKQTLFGTGLMQVQFSSSNKDNV